MEKMHNSIQYLATKYEMHMFIHPGKFLEANVEKQITTVHK